MKVVVRSSQFASVIYIILSVFILMLIFCIIYMYSTCMKEDVRVSFSEIQVFQKVFFFFIFFSIYYFSIVFWFYLSESIQFYFSDFVSDSRKIFGINRPIISALFMGQWILGVGRFHGSVTFGRSVEFSGYSCFLAQ